MNDISFLLKMMQRLRENNIRVWLFGGWAEELLGIRESGEHSDIDLLYPENNFDSIDDFMHRNNDILEIKDKRFSHKRAFLVDNVMIECILVINDGINYLTNFFDCFKYVWPSNTLNGKIEHEGSIINIASKEALSKYRKNHHSIERIYKKMYRESECF